VTPFAISTVYLGLKLKVKFKSITYSPHGRR